MDASAVTRMLLQNTVLPLLKSFLAMWGFFKLTFSFKEAEIPKPLDIPWEGEEDH